MNQPGFRPLTASKRIIIGRTMARSLIEVRLIGRQGIGLESTEHPWRCRDLGLPCFHGIHLVIGLFQLVGRLPDVVASLAFDLRDAGDHFLTGDVLHHGLGFQCFNCSEVAFLRDAQISHILLLFLRFGRLVLDGLGYHYFRAIEFVHRTISLELSLSLLQLLVFHLASIVGRHGSFASSTRPRIC